MKEGEGEGEEVGKIRNGMREGGDEEGGGEVEEDDAGGMRVAGDAVPVAMVMSTVRGVPLPAEEEVGEVMRS